MRIFLASLVLLLLSSAAAAQNGHPCDPYAPYYHKTETGPGALLADLFFFVGSVPHTVILLGGPRRPVVNPQTKERRRVSTVACMPISTAKHFIQNRPVHVEHWRPE